MARGRPNPRPLLLLRPMLRLMLMPTTEATMAMALAMVMAMAMVDMDLAMDMEDMVDTVLDSMARERLSLATMAIMVTREAMDTEPEDTTTARGKPSPDMAIVMDTRDIPMAMVTVSTMDKKAES